MALVFSINGVRMNGEDLLETGFLSDITILAIGGQHAVHRVVLEQGPDTLKSLLNDEKEGVIDHQWLTSSFDLDIVLRHTYTGSYSRIGVDQHDVEGIWFHLQSRSAGKKFRVPEIISAASTSIVACINAVKNFDEARYALEEVCYCAVSVFFEDNDCDKAICKATQGLVKSYLVDMLRKKDSRRTIRGQWRLLDILQEDLEALLVRHSFDLPTTVHNLVGALRNAYLLQRDNFDYPEQFLFDEVVKVLTRGYDDEGNGGGDE